MSNRIRLDRIRAKSGRGPDPSRPPTSDPDTTTQSSADAHAEQAVLGAMMLDAATVEVVCARIGADDYWQPQHAAIHAAIVKVHEQGVTPDPLTVFETLRATGDLRLVHDGALYLHTCIAAVPTTANAGHYATLVAEASSRRRLGEIAARLSHAATLDDPDRRASTVEGLVSDLTHLSQPAGTAPGTVPDGVVARVDWYELWAQASSEVRWEIAPLAERGHSIAIFSEPKTGKSLLALEIACALSTGRRVLANPAREPRRVVYADYENTQTDLHDRLSALGYRPEELDNLIYLSFPPFAPLDTASGGRALAATVQFYGGQVLIIDTASRVVEGAENDADTWNALYRHALIPLKAAGITVIRLDHTGKDPTRGQRGSSAKDGDVDAVWRLVARTPTSLYLKRERTRTGRGDGLIEVVRRFEPLRHEVPAAADTPVSVVSLIAQMDALGLPLDIGRDKARAALARAGIKARTDALTAAIRERKDRILLTHEEFPISLIEDHGIPVPNINSDLQNRRSDLTQRTGTGGVRLGQAKGAVPVPNPVPPYGGQGTGQPGPEVDQERSLISCRVCYGPLDDVDGTGQHPGCEPVVNDQEMEWYR